MLPLPSATRCLPLFALVVAACASPTIRHPSPAHLAAPALPAADAAIPAPLPLLPLPPPPAPQPKTETYSVVVNRVDVHDLLFALARDARLNVDIHAGIAGEVTLNAVNQTLPQLLDRIARQVGMRYEIDGPNLVVMPDVPFLRNYPVDYVNMSRDTTGSLAVATQLVATAAGTAAAPAGGNDSTMRIENRAQHRFWETLLQNIRDILRMSGAPAIPVAGAATPRPDAAPARQGARSAAAESGTPAPAARVAPEQNTEAAAVIAHPETGILAVRATARQHEKVREFLDRVLDSARRQVMIEATLVEVQLSNAYQQGIDWSRIAGSAGFGASLSGPVAAAPGLFALNYRNDSFAGMVKLLDTFGTTKVLSSPKLSVMNNQAAVLKVVDNSVYFTIKADTAQNQTTTVTTYTTTLNQVPVGFVMSVTPQISETDTVLLNVRPSVSRVIGTVRDPNPALRKSAANAFAEDIVSEIPVIRTREMESLLRVRDGDIAVMGGLMEDSLQNKDATVPGLGQLPLLGEAFTQRNDSATKSELVVFLRPTIIRAPALTGDYAALREHLPRDDFFTAIPDPQSPGDKAAPAWQRQ